MSLLVWRVFLTSIILEKCIFLNVELKWTSSSNVLCKRQSHCATEAPSLSFAQVAVVVTEPMSEVVEDISTPPSEPVEAPESGISQA